MDFPLQNTLHIPFVLKTKVDITEYYMWQHCAVSLALHVLPALLGAVSKEQGGVQLYSVFLSTQGGLISVPEKSPYSKRAQVEVERCSVQLAQESSWSHWAWPGNYSTSTLGEEKRFTLLAMAELGKGRDWNLNFLLTALPALSAIH